MQGWIEPNRLHHSDSLQLLNELSWLDHLHQVTCPALLQMAGFVRKSADVGGVGGGCRHRPRLGGTGVVFVRRSRAVVGIGGGCCREGGCGRGGGSGCRCGGRRGGAGVGFVRKSRAVGDVGCGCGPAGPGLGRRPPGWLRRSPGQCTSAAMIRRPLYSGGGGGCRGGAVVSRCPASESGSDNSSIRLASARRPGGAGSICLVLPGPTVINQSVWF